MNMIGSFALKVKNTASSTKSNGLGRQLLALALKHTDGHKLCSSKLLQHQKCSSSSVTDKYHVQSLNGDNSNINKRDKSFLIDRESDTANDQHVNGTNTTSTAAKLDDTPIDQINVLLEHRSLEQLEQRDFKRLGRFQNLRNTQRDEKFPLLNDNIGIANYHSDYRIISVVKSVFVDKQWSRLKHEIRTKIELLEAEGTSKRNILDILYLVKRTPVEKFYNAIKEQKMIFGKINIDQLKKYILPLPDYSMHKALSKVFVCSIPDFEKKRKNISMARTKWM